MRNQSTPFVSSTGESRNPLYEGQFDDETPEQSAGRLHWARVATELASINADHGEAAVVVQVTGSLDEIDAPVWPFINAEAQKVGAEHGRIETYKYERANGGVAVLWDANRLHAMAVTIRDDMNRTRCIRMLAAPHTTDAASATEAPFQARVFPWLLECFGDAIAGDTMERNHRFLEEALELVQACDCTTDEAHKLVDYVFGRRVGERAQEVGGVMVTLAALCLAQGLDMHQAGETELSRITQPTMVELIREKQKAKPAMSPLPGVYRERTEAATAHRRPNPAQGAPKPKGHNPVA